MIDPWGSSIVDYDKLVNQFGIKDFSEIVGQIEDPARLMKRGVIFGHRDFDKLVPLINGKKDFGVMTGMMPSGQMHIGHKMVIDQLKWYFEKGASLSLSIADMESYAARGISFEKAKDIAIHEYLANYIALGLDLTDDKVNVYLQSQNKIRTAFYIQNIEIERTKMVKHPSKTEHLQEDSGVSPFIGQQCQDIRFG